MTTVPTASGAPAKRRTSSFGRTELLSIVVPLTLAVAVTALVFAVTPLSGVFGFVLIALVVFLVALWVSVRKIAGPKAAADRVVTAVITIAALLVASPLLLILATVVKRGVPGLSWHFLTDTLEGVDPSAGSSAGGALHAIVGTISQVAIATLVCVPFGVATAVYLNEIKGRFAGLVRLMVDAMSGIPSIVAGLFIYTVWVVGTGAGFSGFAASLALAMLMLPTVARTSEEMLRLVDRSLREASYALGSSQWRTTLRVVLPTARSGIITAIILGIARVAGETAPLLMTAFGNDRVVGPVKGVSEPQSALPLFIWQQLAQDQQERAWAGALVLISIVLALFVLARYLGRRRPGQR